MSVKTHLLLEWGRLRAAALDSTCPPTFTLKEQGPQLASMMPAPQDKSAARRTSHLAVFNTRKLCMEKKKITNESSQHPCEVGKQVLLSHFTDGKTEAER